ncbi:hypothetical protein COU60_03245 [Candidatus Pacearchaeota archaeon CG10_big_fil_rev_8_21_14_0_10_34_76]|nr:MAG: hypothetical protein COU60_03245 [Candidatus Pacearchaeota archaeon CG10_big_fil_rev_8_21_14_0_10_34_76]
MTEENERRVYEGFAFGTRGREPTELERSLGDIQIRINDLPEALRANEGWFVEVRLGDKPYAGVIRGMTQDGGYVIKPTIHRTPLSLVSDDKIPQMEKSVWLDEAEIAYGPLINITRTSREVLDAMGMGFDSVRHLGKYFTIANRLENPINNTESD